MLNRLKALLGKKSQGFGLEISPERINLAQLGATDRGYKLKVLTSQDVPEGIFEEGKIVDPPQLAEIIKDLLEEHKIKSSRVATAVPMREAIIRLIPIPAELSDQELRDIVLNQEAGLYLPYPREEVDLDFQKLGYFEDEDGIEKVQVLLVATRKEVTDTYLDILEQVGLQVDVLEINSFALIRTLREKLRQFGSLEAVVLVDLEFDSTELAIIVDGIPQFNRTVPIGTFQLHAAFAQAMNLPPSRDIDQLLEAVTVPTAKGTINDTTPLNQGIVALQRVLGELADEIRRSIDFYLSQSDTGVEVVSVLLAGPGAGLSQLDDFFEERLGLTTTQADPIEALALELDEEIPEAYRPGLGTVLGLGLRQS
ncbi:MAG: type IV pilus assembly protein PilM [Cyanobacteria bacterium J06641_5]